MEGLAKNTFDSAEELIEELKEALLEEEAELLEQLRLAMVEYKEKILPLKVRSSYYTMSQADQEKMKKFDEKLMGLVLKCYAFRKDNPGRGVLLLPGLWSREDKKRFIDLFGK